MDDVTHDPSDAPTSSLVGHRPLVVLKCAALVEPEQEMTPFAVDEKGRVAFPECHAKIEIPTAARLKTMPITTTQMTMRTNFLFCMVF